MNEVNLPKNVLSDNDLRSDTSDICGHEYPIFVVPVAFNRNCSKTGVVGDIPCDCEEK
jgi:hypothetical protein